MKNYTRSGYSSFGYTYDDAGNRSGMNTLRTALAAASPLAYLYDDLDRLTQATDPLAGNPDETFTYDPVGNRLRRDGQSTDSVFNAANRLLSDANFNYQYDANGNLTSKTHKITNETTQYTYDSENRLIHIEFSGGSSASYRYDALGRRIEKEIPGSLTRYVYDGEDILLEYDGTNALKRHYTHGLGIDEPLAVRDLAANQSYFYIADGLGSITDITDASGNVAQAYLYDSFGNIVQQAGVLSNVYTYTGREYDAESGLYYYRARYYDPAIGRFLQEDPIEGFLHLPQTLNEYSYVINNPVVLDDPFGENPLIKLAFSFLRKQIQDFFDPKRQLGKYSGNKLAERQLSSDDLVVDISEDVRRQAIVKNPGGDDDADGVPNNQDPQPFKPNPSLKPVSGAVCLFKV